MNRIILLLLVSSVIVLGFSCNQNKSQTKQITANNQQITYSSVSEILSKADKLSEKTVKVKGIIEHVCKHTWKRFKMIDPTGNKELKIELGDNFPSIDASILGKKVKVTGKLISIQMDEKLVLQWEQKMKKNHKGEEDTEHYKEELNFIQEIHAQIVSCEIPFYTTYLIEAEKYEFE